MRVKYFQNQQSQNTHRKHTQESSEINSHLASGLAFFSSIRKRAHTFKNRKETTKAKNRIVVKLALPPKSHIEKLPALFEKATPGEVFPNERKSLKTQQCQSI